MNNIRRLRERDFYYWLKENQDKTLVIECDGYECYSNTQILKEVIDNLVIAMEIDNSGKIFVKIEDNERVSGYNWIATYVA